MSDIGIGARVTWSFPAYQLEVSNLEVIQRFPLSHSSAVAQYGPYMFLVKDKDGKVWPVGSNSIRRSIP